MTAPEQSTDSVETLRAFRAALSPRVDRQLRDTGRVLVLVYRAVHTTGWTPKQLAAECMRDHNGAVNAAAIVMHRLDWCADNPPAVKTKHQRTPLCGHCEDGYVVDPDTRLPIRRCDCRKGTA